MASATRAWTRTLRDMHRFVAALCLDTGNAKKKAS
jgi:hypothetical protein